jgi:2-amino-4-hydroxy-6-hydroxymethyldihydropteridine diphosphokinase
MNKVYLLIGGNMGDRMANLAKAIQLIEKEIGKLVEMSSIYETAAWGFSTQPDFLNQALMLHTQLDATTTMQKLLDIESSMGRIRSISMGPRIIDLDVIYFNNEIISSQLITIPHPKLASRRFVLMPLVEIAPDYIHPVLNRSNKALLHTCSDQLAVYKKITV